MDKYKKQKRQELIKKLFEKQKGRCYWCGCKLSLDATGISSYGNGLTIAIDKNGKEIKGIHHTYELDHIIPRSRGGSDREDNFVLSCEKCNHKKHNKFWMKNKDGSITEIKTPKVSQDVTIAFGNEVRLTTNGLKSKEIFVKFSTAFRNKQLKDLKGSPLSIFLCYALHSDGQGYTWVDDRVIKKETGFYRTREARQKLIKMKYLYQERLYDEQGKFRDWIYRIFQPIEPNKTFVIRGIKQSTRNVNLSSQNDYVGKMPTQAKCEGIIEEEPLIKKEEPISSKEEQAKLAKQIKEIFTLFYKSVNPFIKFGNKTERKAVEDMIKKFGFEKTKRTIEYAISIQGKKYAPTISTPCQFQRKINALRNYFKREQEKNKPLIQIL